jgi:hypothetical protein
VRLGLTFRCVPWRIKAKITDNSGDSSWLSGWEPHDAYDRPSRVDIVVVLVLIYVCAQVQQACNQKSIKHSDEYYQVGDWELGALQGISVWGLASPLRLADHPLLCTLLACFLHRPFAWSTVFLIRVVHHCFEQGAME